MDTLRSKPQGRTVKLHTSTLDRINRLKHRGQSYDGVINELLDFHDSYLAANQNHPGVPQVKTRGKERADISSDFAGEKADV
jgi:hypothetical protein